MCGRVSVGSSPTYVTYTDFLDSLSPSVPIINHSRQVFQAVSSVRTELI